MICLLIDDLLTRLTHDRLDVLLFCPECAKSNDAHSGFLNWEDTSNYYTIMTEAYESATPVKKQFWIWLMTVVMPNVSSDWRTRLQTKQRVYVDGASEQEEESILDYVTLTDFAYIPVVVVVYGKRELDMYGIKRKRGRKKGQCGLTSKESIGLYVDSIYQMKGVLEDEDNKKHVKEWSKAILAHIATVNVPAEGTSDAMLDRILLGAQSRKDIRHIKKDQIYIPV